MVSADPLIRLSRDCGIATLSPKGARGLSKVTRDRRPERPVLRPSSVKRHLVYRVGLGNDVHRLAAGRKLIVGGVRIPFEKGPLGHSDGDALAHAICDALLGAAALGDIGQHFPDDSLQWYNASSLAFLHHIRELLDEAGYEIVNIDSTVGLERPKLAPHIPTMRRNLARALGVHAEQVSVKAKTGEGLDAVGRGAALRADAVVLIVRRGGSDT